MRRGLRREQKEGAGEEVDGCRSGRAPDLACGPEVRRGEGRRGKERGPSKVKYREEVSDVTMCRVRRRRILGDVHWIGGVLVRI